MHIYRCINIFIYFERKPHQVAPRGVHATHRLAGDDLFIYMYIYRHRYRYMDINLHKYIYVCVCVYIYIYMYT